MSIFLFAAATAYQMYGDSKEADSQKRAEEANQRFYEQQKQLAEQATRRALDIFEDESEIVIGDHISSYAKAGIDISGSALLGIASVKAAMGREKTAIESEGRSNAILSGMRAGQAGRVASELGRGRAAAVGGRILTGIAGAQQSGALDSSGSSGGRAGPDGFFSRGNN